jgi:hypothetical protein
MRVAKPSLPLSLTRRKNLNGFFKIWQIHSGQASVHLPNFEADLSFCFLERESGIEHSR